jgi:putative ABC transport system permease protein
MFVFISLKQFFRDMRSQKLRTLLTIFGIMWGTISVILLLAFGTGLQEHQVKAFKGLGEQISIIWSGVTSKPWNGLPRGRRVRLTEEDITNIKASVPGIRRISPEFTGHNVMLKSQRNNLIASVSGIWPEFGPMRNILARDGGRFINARDMDEKRRTVFIGDELAEKLFPGEDPVGQSLQVRGVPFVVVGVMVSKSQDSSYGGRDKRNAYIPATTFHSMYSRRFPNNTIVQATDDGAMKGVIDGFYRYLAAKYNFDPEDTEALMIWDTSEGFKFFYTFFLAFKLFLVGIGCLTLITGGIGVTNIMNVVLEERTKEIGIKMALGAKKATIMFQFMFETILLTFIGGAVGFAVALIIIKFFPMLSLTDELGTPIVHFSESMGAVAILGIIAFLAGFFPARRAANLEPVKALKLF